MRTNYFLKHVTLVVVALFGVASIFAQRAKVPDFVKVTSSLEEDGKAFVPVYEAGAAWGDYNNDGYLDLLSVGWSNTENKATLHKNNGNGTFTQVANPFFALRASSVTWLDYNNDGNLDVFICGSVNPQPDKVGDPPREQMTGLFENSGAGGGYTFDEVFAGEFEYVDNGGKNKPNRYVVAADFDNDGWVDLYVTGQGGARRSLLYKNTGGGYWSLVSAPVNGEKNFVQMNGGEAVWADMNNDGFMDLVTTGYSQMTDDYPELTNGYKGLVYLNNGDGTFTEPVFFFDGTESGGIVVADFNGDGKLDFAITGATNNKDYHPTGGTSWRWPNDIYINNGNGKSYTKYDKTVNGMDFARQEQSLAAGDVNNDGKIDILYSNAHIPANNPADINAFFLNDGFVDDAITFTGSALGHNKTWAGVACLVDYDNDNNLDAFVTGYSNRLVPDGENWTAGAYSALFKNELGDDITANDPPSAPTNLKYTVDSYGDITFTWNAATDDKTPQASLQYNLFLKKASTGEIVSILPAHIETGRLKVNENLAALTTTSYTLRGWTIEDGDVYGVQAIDGAKAGGKFCTVIKGNDIPTVIKDNIDVSIDGKTVTMKANVAGNVAVYGVSGVSVAQTKINTPVELATGVYVIKVTTANGSTVKKVVVK